MIRRVAAFVAGVLATYVLAAVVSTQMILGEVAALGLPVNFGDRAAATLHDLAGMAMAYLPLIGASLLIAFPVAALVLRYVRLPRAFGYALAGGAAIWALHLIMIATFGMHPVPATRTALGLALQAGAGLVGGYVFARITAGVSRTTAQ
ncbi:MAG: hypothetical protein F4Y55_03180 [Gammaproteobacteria bacterium]|nr:hypothetical protein [Gammaproteobacteria bacterium]